MSNASATGASKPQTDPTPLWPVETEIYILPSGEVVVADLPAELRALIQAVGAVQPSDDATSECEADVADESDQSS